MSNIILGFDIGRRGGIAILTDRGDLVDVLDMPTLRDGPAHAEAFARKGDDGRAEAALIGLAGLKREAR